MMPLSLAGIGEEVTIREVKGDDDVRHRLTEMGFIPGDTVTVVSVLQGNLILQVKDARIALNRGTANHIYVD